MHRWWTTWVLTVAHTVGCSGGPEAPDAAPDATPVAAPAVPSPGPAPAPSPAPAPEVVPEAAPVAPESAGPFEPTPPDAFVHCVEVDGVLEVTDPAALAAVPRRDAPGCADRAPPAFDVETQKLVLFGTIANCNGAVEANDAAFRWSQWGDCERAEILRAQRVIPKEAPPPMVQAVPWHEHQVAQRARFEEFAARVRDADVAGVRTFVGDAGIRFVWTPLEDGEPRIVERTRDTLTRADLVGTVLHQRKLRRFRCSGRGDHVLCVARGDGFMNAYHLSPRGDGFTVRVVREASHRR